jgi:ketosteroid isomerase-like protein
MRDSVPGSVATYCADDARENVDMVLDQFAATNERDFPRAMSHYAEDVVLVVDPR